MASNLIDIIQSIDELSSRGKISRQRGFAAWFAINFFSLDEDDALEAAAADGGNDQGMDIVFSDEASQEIIILQAHCPENVSRITPKNKWDTLVDSIPYIVTPENLLSAGRLDLAETLILLRKEHPSYTVTVGLISLGLRSSAIDLSVKAHAAQGAYKDFAYFYYSQEDIADRYQTLVGSEFGIPEDTLSFTGGHFEDEGEYGRAWIGSVSAIELQRLHAAYQDRLFAGNVRLFIGARKGGINEQIIKTAKDNPGAFWALNNGITIVADTVLLKDQDGKSGLTLKRFSIVNGCQTTSSLVRAEASETAKVLARVIAAKSTLRNEVVRYNNSQNAVKIWTVRAVDDIQQQLRREFAKVDISYAPKREGARILRSASTIELDRVTQFLAASDENFLLQAIDKKAELFDQPYQKLFPRGIKAAKVYLAWLTGILADEERQSLFDAMSSDENVGLLGVASGHWIAFCAYKMFERFSDMRSAQLKLEKMNTVVFRNAVQKYAERAATTFYDAAVDTYEREEYGSIKSTLRSAKFLQKINSKIGSRIAKIKEKDLPDLAAVCKSIKV